MDAYGFRTAREIEACQFATVAARYVAIYGDGDGLAPADAC